MVPQYPVLLVDDEIGILESYKLILKMAGINNVLTCCDSREAIPILKAKKTDVVVLDLTMPYITGDELLQKIKTEFPDIPVIIATVNTEINAAVNCMKIGAVDYILKPVEENRFIASIKKAAELRELRRENQQLKQKLIHHKLEKPDAFFDIITKDERMLSLFHYMEAIKRTGEPILITGETGTGKGLFAKAFHAVSGRNGKFVSVNTGGLDDQMFSDTLFGHKKGAFTDAVKDRPGFVERAASGTLFLDEIGDLSLASQVKLLNLLQDKEYYALGDDIPRYSDAQIIAATNKDLDNLQETGEFRKDLYYRLDVHRFHIPPLRERTGDLPLLVDLFLEEAAKSLGKKKPTPPPELFALLASYAFPGNIRELRSMVFKAVSFHKTKMLSLDSFKEHLFKNKKYSVSSTTPNHPKWLSSTPSDPLPTLKEVQETYINIAMEQAGNNQSIAAKIIGITQQALSKRLKKLKQNP